MSSPLEARIQQLSEEVSDLCLPVSSSVPELASVPTALEFLRDWCCPNRPFIVRRAARRWAAASKWTPQYFRQQYGDKKVTVAVTPTGYADAISGEHLALPEERTMTMADFLDILQEPEKHNGVFYIQKQNSNLTDELPELFSDVPCDVSWATEALGQSPDAVNFWMGDGRAVTSLHKDHYENIYCVLRGHKDLVLLPPTDRAWLPHRLCTSATYRQSGDTFVLEPDPEGDQVPWADWDPVKCCRPSREVAWPGGRDGRGAGTSSRGAEGRGSGGDGATQTGDVPNHRAPTDSTSEHSRLDGGGEGVVSNGVAVGGACSRLAGLSDAEIASRLHPLHCRLEAGDLLYLPSLWFHHLRQSHGCVAVNYWYDMQFDLKYCYFKFLESLSET